MSLEIRGLGKEFQRVGRRLWAVKDVALSVSRGELVCITGRSGSGKSTLLNLIAGLLEPTEGDILLEGISIVGLPDKEASRLRGGRLGMILQGDSMLRNLTIYDNVRLPRELFSRDEDREWVYGLLERVGIAHLEGAYPAGCSGGELRRAAIARALVNRPVLLLADEPTGNLDAENTHKVMKLFREIADQGTAVLMVTHETDVLHYGDEVYRMQEGRLEKGGEGKC